MAPCLHYRAAMDISIADSDSDVLDCYPVLSELRTHLDDRDAFLERVRLQQQTGYRLALLRDGQQLLAVAGFRIGENLAWGRHLYVDDLVTLPDARSRGCGTALLAWLAELGQGEGCGQLHLDSGHHRKDAHRFYEREGLVAAGLHFQRSL